MGWFLLAETDDAYGSTPVYVCIYKIQYSRCMLNDWLDSITLCFFFLAALDGPTMALVVPDSLLFSLNCFGKCDCVILRHHSNGRHVGISLAEMCTIYLLRFWVDTSTKRIGGSMYRIPEWAHATQSLNAIQYYVVVDRRTYHAQQSFRMAVGPKLWYYLHVQSMSTIKRSRLTLKCACGNIVARTQSSFSLLFFIVSPPLCVMYGGVFLLDTSWRRVRITAATESISGFINSHPFILCDWNCRLLACATHCSKMLVVFV